MATHQNTANLVEELQSFLEAGAKEAIGRVFDEAVAHAVEEANKQRDEFIAKTAVRLRSWTQIEDFTNRLVITIEKPKESA